MTDNIALQVLRLLEQNPEISQREMARQLGISLGKTNYCVRALLEKGWVKAKGFKDSNNKLRYTYLLTPSGIENKASLSIKYLKAKMVEYERLKSEIEQLQKETRLPRDR